MRLTQPLHVHISTLFLALTLLIGGLIGWHGYRTSAELVQASASEQSSRIGRQVQEEFRNALEPAEMAIKLVRYHRITFSATLSERLASLDFLGEVLDGSPALSALYVGYANGDFLLLRRLNAREQGLTGAPPEARYLVQSIERGPQARGRYIYLDAAREVILTLDRPDYVQAYDPRRRGWWQQAQVASGLVQTEPYPFFTNRSVGITLAKLTRARSFGIVHATSACPASWQAVRANASCDNGCRSASGGIRKIASRTSWTCIGRLPSSLARRRPSRTIASTSAPDNPIEDIAQRSSAATSSSYENFLRWCR